MFRLEKVTQGVMPYPKMCILIATSSHRSQWELYVMARIMHFVQIGSNFWPSLIDNLRIVCIFGTFWSTHNYSEINHFQVMIPRTFCLLLKCLPGRLADIFLKVCATAFLDFYIVYGSFLIKAFCDNNGYFKRVTIR